MYAKGFGVAKDIEKLLALKQFISVVDA